MRWREGRRSENIEDRRGRVGPRRAAGVGGLGILVILAFALLTGQDPTAIIDVMTQGGGMVVDEPASGDPSTAGGPTDEAADFVSVVLADTEDTWGALFAASGQEYHEPTLVLYTDVVESACGVNSAATGPFYCPGDAKVYLDLGFLNQLQRMGASGDFAVAYVIAHEIGHHIQNLTGTEREVRQLMSRVGRVDANALSVLMELQADCYAGVWAHHADAQRDILDTADIQAGLDAAAAVGDDRLMKAAGRRVQREAFTHGSSEERMRWFMVGWEQGSYQACDTFAEAGLR